MIAHCVAQDIESQHRQGNGYAGKIAVQGAVNINDCPLRSNSPNEAAGGTTPNPK